MPKIVIANEEAIAAATTITIEQHAPTPLLPLSHDGFDNGKAGGRTWKCW